MNELQAALFFGLLSIPFAIAFGVKLTRGIFRVILLLAAAAVLIRRAICRTLRAVNDGILRFARAIELAIVHAPRDAYNAIDRLLQWLAPPTLAGFRVEYSTLEYYVRTSERPLTLEQHLQVNGCPGWSAT